MYKKEIGQVEFPTPTKFLSYGRKQILFLKSFFNFAQRYKNLWPSHALLAEAGGCSVSTARRVLADLEEMGLVIVERRGYPLSNRYHLSPTIFHPEFKAFMRRIYVAFSLFMPLYFLASNPVQENNERVLDVKGSYLLTLSDISKLYYYQPTRFDSIQQRQEAYAAVTGAFPREHRIGIGKKSRSSEAMYNPIRQTILDLKSIQLTQYGQIELESFPDAAIEYAEKKMASVAKPRDRFKLFVSFCNEFCRQNQIVPNWRKVYHLRDVYPREADAKMYIEPESSKTGRASIPNKPYTRSTVDDELNEQVKREAQAKQTEWELSRGILTDEDRWNRLIKPNLHFMPSWAVADLVARGKLPDCPETRARIAEETGSPLSQPSYFAKASEDRQESTQQKANPLDGTVDQDQEDHSTQGIFDW